MRIFSLVLLVAASAAMADNNHAHSPSPYVGQDAQTLKNLSAADIDELKRGGGWGLAKVAELNGIPGPAHLLELKDAIPLSHKQISEIEKIFSEMKTEAIAMGDILIAAESRLEAAFQSGPVGDTELQAMLRDVADARRELQYVHLSRHLSTPALLEPQQISRYNTLRGYGADEPCGQVPDGHDPAQWRKHNSCD